jgi:hypothetical protein
MCGAEITGGSTLAGGKEYHPGACAAEGLRRWRAEIAAAKAMREAGGAA